MRIALFLANIQNCSNYMRYVIVRYDQISVDAHAHAARYNEGTSRVQGLDSDRTSRKFGGIYGMICYKIEKRYFSRAHCTPKPRQRFNRLPFGIHFGPFAPA